VEDPDVFSGWHQRQLKMCCSYHEFMANFLKRDGYARKIIERLLYHPDPKAAYSEFHSGKSLG
jgi:hypothetical protein